ncbi:CAP domain-containing protein [Paenibacillus sp. FA6]|uniref:CAP domain-containing protein n=1 Tax=Paenibacillus sp. FA6 TaxID=3413029 RepID=UPI003F65C189
MTETRFGIKRRVKQLKWIVYLSLLVILGIVGTGTAIKAESLTYVDVPESHWAYEMVKWSQSNGISNGYDDGTFRPSQIVTETEFLVMVLRAYPQVAIRDSVPHTSWYEPYYDVAKGLEWPISGEVNQNMKRGQVAELFAAVMGQPLSQKKSIQLLLDKGIAQGKQGGSSLESFAPNDVLSRAEAQTFIYRLKQVHPTLKDSEIQSTGLSLNGISLGDTETRVITKLGQPKRKDATETNMIWYIYNQDYSKYAQIGVQDGKVIALYSNADGWSIDTKMGLNNLEAEAKKLWGDTVSVDSKGRWKSYEATNYEVTLFMDTLGNGKSESLLVNTTKMNSSAQDKRSSTGEVLTAFERQIFDLTNVVRIRKGLNALEWNNTAANAARKHSQDMALRNYFSHDSPDGKSTGDRLAASGAGKYRAYGENISAGYKNAIYAYSGWLNSSGHRSNILKSSFETLGVGVAFGISSSDYNIYYTQNFFTPL